MGGNGDNSAHFDALPEYREKGDLFLTPSDQCNEKERF
jgi:hypothetical protein